MHFKVRQGGMKTHVKHQLVWLRDLTSGCEGVQQEGVWGGWGWGDLPGGVTDFHQGLGGLRGWVLKPFVMQSRP